MTICKQCVHYLVCMHYSPGRAKCKYFQERLGRMKGFTVIDNQTGNYPDCEKIALSEDWAKHLCYCDIDSFAITEDGGLILMDDCGKCAYCPDGRFTVVTDNNVGCKVSPTDKDINVPSKWISVTERLPDKDGHYLCNYHFGEYPKMTFTQVLDYYATDIVPHFQHTLGDGSMKVTHWMPLPEPPKGE